MTTNAQIGLKTVLALLNDITTVNRATDGVSFNGTAETNDLFVGSAGNNVARGNQGNDLLLGNDGNDLLSGGNGNDALFGGTGDDRLSGGNGNDFITGDAGNDVLIGDSGVDQLTGGAGADQFVYTGDVFANGIPVPAGKTGINVLNQPDVDFRLHDRRRQVCLQQI